MQRWLQGSVFLHAWGVELSPDKFLHMEYTLVGCHLMVLAGLEDISTYRLGHHNLP